MTTMRYVREWQPCAGCKKPGETQHMEETMQPGVAGSNEWWHPDCLEEALEEHPDWDLEYPCRDCGGDGMDDDVSPCPTCEGEGRTD